MARTFLVAHRLAPLHRSWHPPCSPSSLHVGSSYLEPCSRAVLWLLHWSSQGLGDFFKNRTLRGSLLLKHLPYFTASKTRFVPQFIISRSGCVSPSLSGQRVISSIFFFLRCTVMMPLTTKVIVDMTEYRTLCLLQASLSSGCCRKWGPRQHGPLSWWYNCKINSTAFGVHGWQQEHIENFKELSSQLSSEVLA